MGSIAILYICTSVYKKFWAGFFESYQQNFLPDTRKEYYIMGGLNGGKTEAYLEMIKTLKQKKLVGKFGCT